MGVQARQLWEVFTRTDSEYRSVEACLGRELWIDATDIHRLRALCKVSCINTAACFDVLSVQC